MFIFELFAAKRFIMLQIAKDVLSCPGSRKKYDQWLNSGLAISFKEWCSMTDKTHSVSIYNL